MLSTSGGVISCIIYHCRDTTDPDMQLVSHYTLAMMPKYETPCDVALIGGSAELRRRRNFPGAMASYCGCILALPDLAVLTGYLHLVAFMAFSFSRKVTAPRSSVIASLHTEGCILHGDCILQILHVPYPMLPGELVRWISRGSARG